ncbi:hypothetical protein U1Q18_002536 [Sarracenia purpurea var. burkii]
MGKKKLTAGLKRKGFLNPGLSSRVISGDVEIEKQAGAMVEAATRWSDGAERCSAATRSGVMARSNSVERWGGAGGSGDQASCTGGVVSDAQWQRPVVLHRKHNSGTVAVKAEALCA